MNDIMQSALVIYCVLYVIKFCLTMPSLPLAAAAVSRRESGKHWSWFWFAVMLIAVPVALFIFMIPLLMTERLGFFVLYRKRAVLRDIILATRE